MVIIGKVINYGRSIIEYQLGQLLSFRVKKLILQKVATLDLGHFEDSNFHDKLLRAQRGASYRPLSLLNDILRIMRDGVSLSSMILVLISLHWLLIFVLLLVALPKIIIHWYYINVRYRLMCNQTSEERKIGYISNILTSLNVFKEIKFYNLITYFIKQYATVFNNIYKQQKLLWLKENTTNAGVFIMSKICYYGYYLYIILNNAVKMIKNARQPMNT